MATLAEAVTDNHTVTAFADLYRGGVPIAVDLPVTGGGTVANASAAVRRQGNLTIVDTGGLTPSGPTDKLAPYGNQLKLYRGIAGSDTERAPLGVFRIADADVADDGSKSIQIAAFDMSRAVARARFESPYTITAGTNYVTAIQALIDNRVAGLTHSAVTTTATTPLLVIDENADPWQEATKMAQSFGFELFFDTAGVVTLRPEPDPATLPLKATYAEGDNATIISANNKLSDEPGYNIFVAIGEPPNATPVRSVAYDDDPASPTYYLGPYGKVPYFLRSPLITSQAQCDAAAAAGLLREMGGTEQLQFSAIPDPTLEPGHLVRVVRSNIGVDDLYLVEAVSIPLGVEGDMTVTTRKKRS